MSLVFNTKTFSANSYNGNKVTYIGPAKSVSVKDDLVLSFIAPKPTPVFSGVSRTTTKLTRTLTLTGALTPTGDAIVEVNVSMPFGAASADIDAILNDVGAEVSAADYKTMVKTQKIAF